MGSGQRSALKGEVTRACRPGIVGLGLLAVIALAVWLGPTAGDNHAEANHSTVTIGLDMDKGTNTALALDGSFQACRVISIGQAIDVDLYVQGVNDIASFEIYIKYDNTKLAISKPGASNQGQNSRFLMQQAQPSPPGNNFSNTSEALPDTANPGIYRVGGFDQVITNPQNSDPDPLPSGTNSHKDGVLVRLEVQGLSFPGFTPLQISPFITPAGTVGPSIVSSIGADVGDGGDADQFVDNVINGGLVVGSGTCADSDGDGVPDTTDNCPATPNSNQANFDLDANGDVCDTDDDNDGLVDASEPTAPTSCTGNPLPSPHAGQFDPDCDDDNVSDGANNPDGGGPIVAGPDNCILVANTNQLNSDGDSLGNACDPDDDNDGILDGADNCPVDTNSSQSNMDGDSLGDACDLEDDGDGYSDSDEAHVLTNSLDNCGSHTTSDPYYSQAWPADIYSAPGQPVPSINKVTLQDLTSFLGPVRYFGTNIGAHPPHDLRWDIFPGKGVFQTDINLQDITSLITVMPLMFGGTQRAFGYPTPCTP